MFICVLRPVFLHITSQALRSWANRVVDMRSVVSQTEQGCGGNKAELGWSFSACQIGGTVDQAAAVMTPDFDARRGGAQSSAGRLDGIIPACRSQLEIPHFTCRQTGRLQGT